MENEMSAAADVRYDLSVARDPKQVIAEAMGAAKALQSIIKQKTRPVKFNGEQYIEFEDWQVLGKFYGVTAKIVSTETINIDGVKGFLARAEAIDTAGRIVSAAEAMCLNDEEKWSTRAKYEYQAGERVKIGDVAVPLFQLRSMAQTRAAAKALRNVLAWVVVMAGFRPNVAEEMTGDENQPANEPIKPAEKKEGAPSDVISEAQGKRLYAIMKGAGKTIEEMAGYLKNTYGYSNSREVKKSDYEAICTWASVKKTEATGDAQE